MAKDTHITAPTRFVKAGGIRYAYRAFGAETGTPLVFLQHFRGGPDPLAQGRSAIPFNNAGVASSTSKTPNTIDAMSVIRERPGITSDRSGGLHAFATHSERTIYFIFGLWSWRAVPVSRTLRGAHEGLLGCLKLR
jgi:hypothetical protein